MFVTLMVGVRGSSAVPHRGPTVDVFTLMVGALGSPSALTTGAAVDIS
jgi:hypothetical protein